jgi:gliding motility-associated lipoprotein GldD
MKIKNSSLNSTLYLSKINIQNNFSLIDSDFSKKINENSKNAFVVNVSEYNDLENKVFAKYFSFIGDAPSNTRFYITDSISVYLTGSLYFDSKPNYDSLLPSIHLLNNDIRKMIQTFKWK